MANQAIAAKLVIAVTQVYLAIQGILALVGTLVQAATAGTLAIAVSPVIQGIQV